MRVVVPGKADPAVNLDTFPRGMHVGVCSCGLGHAREDGKLRIVFRRGLRRVVGSGFGQLDFQQHIRALVLDRLKRADGAAELGAQLRVLDRGLQQPLRPAHHFVRQCDGCQVENPRQCLLPIDISAESGNRHALKIHLSELARRVKGGERASNDPWTVRRRHMERQLVL